MRFAGPQPSTRGVAIVCLAAVGLFAGIPAAGAHVAVFVDPDWATMSRNDVLPAPLMADVVARHLPVTRLTADALADPTRLDAAKLPVLVLPDTDTLPAVALPTLRAYRRAGGCLVMFRDPFVKVAIRAASARPGGERWTSTRAPDLRGHDDAGLALFRIAGPVRHDRPCTRTVPGSPLGITTAMLESRMSSQDRLDVRSLDAEDELIPLVIVSQEGLPALPIAAAIRHGCPQAKGARDVWLGQTCWNLDARERWFAEQLLVRGVAWCLREKGLLTATEVAAVHATLDAVTRPAPPPDGLPLARSPRPWGESLVPRSPPPARRLAAVELGNLPLAERAALTCLQGLTSRREPSIWLLRSAEPQGQDRFWLDEHVRQGAIEGYDVLGDWTSLVRAHADEIRGAVVADPACDRGDVIAMNVAACEDLLLCTPELAERLGLPVTIDLRGRFASYLDGMEWVWKTYRGRFCRHALNYFHPTRLQWGNVDQCYQWRIPLVWTSYKDDAFAAGADPALEHALVARMLAALDTQSVVMGWPACGPRQGVDEYIAVMQASPYGHGYVPNDGLANASVTSGVAPAAAKQPAQPPDPPVEPGRIYLSVVISDGDNLSPWLGYFREHYFAPDTPAFPFGITVGPSIRDALPVATRWYYERARPGTEFLCGVSGATYVSPEVFADRLADPQAVWRIFLADTARMMRPLGLETLNISPRGEHLADRYARALPFCHSIVSGWNRRDDDPDRLVERLPCGMPAFWSATPNRLQADPAADGGAALVGSFYGDLEILLGRKLAAGEPVFVSTVLSCWDWKKEPLRTLVARKPPHVVFVTPAQLARLSRGAVRRGGP